MSTSTVSRVVVGFDGSAAGGAALEAGIEEAAAWGVPVHVATVVDAIGYAPAYRSRSEEISRRATARAAAVLGPERVEHSVEIGHPAPELIRLCRPDDLLVVGTHGHRPVARVLLGSTSMTVAAHAPCPVLVVRGPRRRRPGPVVVGVDGSDRCRSAISYAADLAAREDVPLAVVLGLPPVSDAMGFVTGPRDTQVSAAESFLSTVVDGVVKDHQGLVVRPAVVQTHAVEALLRHARDASTVVVGSRGHGTLASLVLGSVSREMLQHSPVPVVVVRPAAVPRPRRPHPDSADRLHHLRA